MRTARGVTSHGARDGVATGGFVFPLFVTFGHGVRREVTSMPNVYQISVDQLGYTVEELRELGINSVLLFGIPETKDALATQAYHPDGVIQQAIRELKRVDPEFVVIGDVCNCEYTDHGHCGILTGDTVDNDATLHLLAMTAVAQAEAGVIS